MPDTSLLECFQTPGEHPILIEHVAEEFTSLCPKTGHPDFGEVVVRFVPRPASDNGQCVELKSLKLYFQSFRDEGIFYEAVTGTIHDHLAELMTPQWLQIETHWRGRGGIRSVITAESGDLPDD